MVSPRPSMSSAPMPIALFIRPSSPSPACACHRIVKSLSVLEKHNRLILTRMHMSVELSHGVLTSAWHIDDMQDSISGHTAKDAG